MVEEGLVVVSKLEGVAEVDRRGDACRGQVGGARVRYDATAVEHPGGLGELDGYGVQVDADDVLLEFVEGFRRGLPLLGGDDVAYEALDEGARSAGGVHRDSAGGLVDEFVRDGLCEPSRSVVLAHAASFFWGDGVLVEDGCQFVGLMSPVELCDFACDGGNVLGCSDFGWPLEQVGFDDAFESGAKG